MGKETLSGRISKIKLNNYRNFEHLELSLKPLNVLVGPNASGKTNFTEALITLRKGAEGKLVEWVSSLGGFKNSILNRFGEAAGFLTISLERTPFEDIPVKGIKGGRDNLLYEVSLASKGNEFYVSRETLCLAIPHGEHEEPFKFLDRDFGQGAAFRNPMKKKFDIIQREDFKEAELAISQVYDREIYPVPSRMRDYILSWRFYPGQWNLAEIRKPYLLSAVPEDRILSPDGSNLVNVFYHLWESEAREDLQKILTWAYPGFEDIKFPVAAHGYVELRWKEKGLKPYPVTHLSNGTIRLLCVLAVLFQEGPSLVVIEEPEQGLHPYLARVIGELISEKYEYPGNTQWIIITHSPFILDGIGLEKAETVFIFEDNNAIVLPPDKLQTWQENFESESLGHRFTSGEMGGVP